MSVGKRAGHQSSVRCSSPAGVLKGARQPSCRGEDPHWGGVGTTWCTAGASTSSSNSLGTASRISTKVTAFREAQSYGFLLGNYNSPSPDAIYQLSYFYHKQYSQGTNTIFNCFLGNKLELTKDQNHIKGERAELFTLLSYLL